MKKKVNNKKNASDLNTGTLTNNETECADDVKSSRANIDIGTAARLWNASFWSGLIGIIPTIIMMYKKSLRYFNADVLKSSTLASGYLAIYIPVACGGVIVGSVLAAVGKRFAYRGKSAIVPMFFAFLCFTWQYTVTLVLYGHDDALLFGSLPAVAALLTAAGIYYEVFSGWKKKKSSDNSPSKKDNSI